MKSNDECKSVFNAANVTLGPSQFCAGGWRGSDSCRGDSGGPLIQINMVENSNWFVAGVMSFGPYPCDREGWPNIYTKVTEYMPWIISKLRA